MKGFMSLFYSAPLISGGRGFYLWLSGRCNIKKYIYIFLTILCCLFSGGSFAESRNIAGFISPDNVNLSTQDFLTFYANNNTQEKENTLMYVLGVADATEGKTWCGYSRVDSTIINQTILSWLEQRATVKPDIRASTLIEEALVKHFPCTGTESSVKISSRLSPVLSLNPGALNLSGNDFLRFWVSGNQQDKLRAGVYLLGVEDITEKKIWCGYDLFKTLTLNEFIYIFLKNKTHKELNFRAADLIVGKLMEYPCNAGKNK